MSGLDPDAALEQGLRDRLLGNRNAELACDIARNENRVIRHLRQAHELSECAARQGAGHIEPVRHPSRRIDGAALLVDRKSEADPVCLQRTRGGKAGKERLT